jgi:hypothetical protein
MSLSAHRTLFESYHGLKLRLAHHQTTWLDDLVGRFQVCGYRRRNGRTLRIWSSDCGTCTIWSHGRPRPASHRHPPTEREPRRCELHHNGYHETITAATHNYLPSSRPSRTDMPLELQALDLLAGPLAVRDVLFTFYSRDRLMSTTARPEWPVSTLRRLISRPRQTAALPLFKGKSRLSDRDRGVGSA